MKKSIRRILLLLLTVTAVICAVFGLAACSGGSKLQSISIENAKTVFFVGDEFEYGENFTVYAHYGDGSKVDVTQSVEVRKESGFDMNTPGNYQLTVIYENKREIYTVYVNDFSSPLRKIELNTEKVKKQFELGERVSLDGLIITSTYENAQGNLVTSTSSSLRDLTVTIVDESGNVIERDGVFESLGEYVITVSSGSVKDSYTVSVEGINISTVQGAMAVGTFYKSKVLAGSLKIREAIYGGSLFDSSLCTYEYGNNFTKLSDSSTEQYFSVDGEGIFGITKRGEIIEANNNVTADMINGAPVHLWYLYTREYGIESVLANLYEEAVKCTNNDLRETVDEDRRTYTFAFSGLVFRSNDSSYFETAVSFTLGKDYNFQSVKVIQTYWENNSESSSETPSFITDENGITKPNNRFSHQLEVTVNQTAGERTSENPYNREMFRVQSYNLVYGGNVLGDNGTVNCGMGGKDTLTLTVNIANILPATATFAVDRMYFSLQGGANGEQDSTLFLSENGFMAWRRDNVVTVQIKRGGTFVLRLRTTNLNKTITFNVTGNPPVSMSPYIYNEASGNFGGGGAKLIALNGSVYFYGAVNDYANPAQSCRVTSDNAADATVEKTEMGGVSCFKFTAAKEGVYTVTVTSDVASGVSCTLTFTVSDVPDYEGLLKGNYTVTDLQGNIFTLSFTPSEGLTGTVTVTKTPTELDGTPITGEAKTAVYSYSVDIGSLTITLTRASGDNLGIGLTVDASGRLTLIDQYGDRYALTKAE